MYGDPELRAKQVRRVADFPHVGDLMVLSTVYPDGTVAAMEELIGNHGGMGGEQTDAFMFHPDDMVVPPTANSADVFHILNARRDTPVSEIKPKKQALVAEVDAWTPSTWIAGLGRGKVWLGRMLRAMALDRSAYQEVARDPYMTGPAALIGVAGLALSAIALVGRPDAPTMAGRIVLWPIVALLLQITARLLLGKGTYTSTFRVMGFAYAGYLLILLSVVPVIGPLAKIIGFLLAFLGVWSGVAQAHDLRGWRTLLLPVLAVIVFAVVGVVLRALFLGAALTIESVLAELGL
jgi:hypothetical protein